MANPLEGFDLNNPVMPKSIKKRALRSGGYPYDEKMEPDAFEAEMLSAQQQLALLQADQAFVTGEAHRQSPSSPRMATRGNPMQTAGLADYNTPSPSLSKGNLVMPVVLLGTLDTKKDRIS